jgi:hypothetical protein
VDSELIGNGSSDFFDLGEAAVALSGDGKILALRNSVDGLYRVEGKAWLFAAGDDGAWQPVGDVLEVSDGVFLGGVALSSDGSTLAVGGETLDGKYGAVWVYARDTGLDTWVQQGSKLALSGSSFGVSDVSVAISANGDLIAAGGRRVGVWLFQRDAGGEWAQEVEQVTETDTYGISYPGFGSSVSLSGDGRVLRSL